jgi:CheY-like chemotaxis protein
MEGAPEFSGEAFDNDFGDDGFAAEAENGSNGQPAPGMGQSKSSRRRRRKRKKATTGSAAAPENGSGESTAGDASFAAVPVVMEGESLALAASAAPQRRPAGNGFQQGQNGGQQGQGQGQGKRWKKKFRDRDRRPGQGGAGGEFRSENNGGGFSGGGSGFGGDRQFNNDRPFNGDRGYDRPYRREGGRPDNFGNLISHQARKTKGQGGKERGFVGPMDHSYRDMSSEFADAPPSTIQMRGRHGRRHFGDNQPIDYNAPRPVPIPDDAQTHIYMFVEDLFITAKVQESAKKLGVKVAFVKNEKDAIAELTSGDEQNKPALIVFDLNNANAKPLTLIPKLKAKLKRSASIIGFLSTIQGDLKAKAVEAGCDTVMPRAAFSQNLPNLLRRYGVEEAEEINYNY